MKSLESLFHKHLKNFVDPEHEKVAVRGYQVDEDGFGLATNGIQLLKVKIAEAGEPKILTLSGKPVKDAEKVDLHRLIPDRDPVATIDVESWLDAAAAFIAVMSKSDASEKIPVVKLSGEEGKIYLSFKLLDGSSGSWEIGEGESLERNLDGKRLLQCLKVFEGYAGKVGVSGSLSGFRPILMSADDVEVLLMPVRSY
ncbi:hypothetical protein ACFQ38_00235 [Sporosarcina contaminans]|uniref:Uncharacterized protein n=1 Tax=Sporosarcina contaminans TaxID=633403 RepID=A0ABW3TTD8_9BACL